MCRTCETLLSELPPDRPLELWRGDRLVLTTTARQLRLFECAGRLRRNQGRTRLCLSRRSIGIERLQKFAL